MQVTEWKTLHHRYNRYINMEDSLARWSSTSFPHVPASPVHPGSVTHLCMIDSAPSASIKAAPLLLFHVLICYFTDLFSSTYFNRIVRLFSVICEWLSSEVYCLFFSQHFDFLEVHDEKKPPPLIFVSSGPKPVTLGGLFAYFHFSLVPSRPL